MSLALLLGLPLPRRRALGRLTPLGRHCRECLSNPVQARRVAREGLPALDRHIDIARVDFDGVAGPAGNRIAACSSV